jgi:hypothetical protein
MEPGFEVRKSLQDVCAPYCLLLSCTGIESENVRTVLQRGSKKERKEQGNKMGVKGK